MAKRESPMEAVRACDKPGRNRAEIYQCAIGRGGLYTKTFFNRKATPSERRWINDAWHEATRAVQDRRSLAGARRRRARRRGRR